MSKARTFLIIAAALMLMAANAPGPLAMDVWYSAVDDNGLALNPVWEYSREGKGLPNGGILCDHFPNRNGILYVQNCTSQEPVVDEPRPFHGIVPNDRYYVCSYWKDRGGANLRRDSVHGHVNWGVVTYNGTISFSGFGFPPFADGDWDWYLETQDKAGYLASNDPNGIIAEFKGAEVAGRLTTPWWMDLRKTVLGSRHDPSLARAAAQRLPAIVTGILGIDTKHTEHAEVHPIYALALRTDGDEHDETWNFFVRNWGNEGGCSNDQHNYNTRTISFFFPSRAGKQPWFNTTSVYTQLRSTNPGMRWGTTTTSDGLVVTFELGPPSAHSMVFGQFQLCFEPAPNSDLVECRINLPEAPSPSSEGYPLVRDDSIAVVRHRTLSDADPRLMTRDVNH